MGFTTNQAFHQKKPKKKKKKKIKQKGIGEVSVVKGGAIVLKRVKSLIDEHKRQPISM
jgi:hypothetical protein